MSYRDRDGIGSEKPFPLDLVAVGDLPPRIEARPEGISSIITRQARIPIALSVEDDYGLASLEYQIGIDSSEPASSPIPLAEAGVRKYEETVVYDVVDLELSPGRKLALKIVAKDGDTINGPHEAGTEQFVFEVVEPAELLSRMAARELNLRQRFEQIIRELESSRKLLSEIDVAASDAGSPPRFQLERVVQDLRKSGNEAAGVAEGFRDIFAELVNNRIGNRALLDRLEQGIILPADGLLSVEFPETERLLDEAKHEPVQQRDVDSAGVAFDRLIARCREILSAMRKLESFNEAVALLRDILVEHEEIMKKTKEERKKAVLELLE